jgi:hypothetical protein
MGVRDLPLGLIAVSGVIAAFAYGFMKLVQNRRFFNDKVRIAIIVAIPEGNILI